MKRQSFAKSPGLTIGRNPYGFYAVPKGLEQRPAARAVLRGDIYEPQTLAFMRRHAGQGDVIHAGTFFGDFLPGLSQALAPDARLWAFEPSPINFAAAKQTIRLNGLPNVTLTQGGLTDHPGRLMCQTHDPEGAPLGGVSHCLPEGADPAEGSQPVPAVMLDYTVPLDRPVSILQLDVEGHEMAALRGAYHLIHRWKPILILEYFEHPMWLKRNFRGVSYKYIGKLHGNVVYAVEETGITL